MEARWTQADDDDLVALWRRDPGGPEGTPAAAELLGRYRRRVYRWCHGYVRDHEAALDLAQDVLLTAHQKIGSLRDGHRFGSWLFTVARNRCLAAMRRDRRWESEPVEVDELPTGSPTPEQDLLDRLAERRFLELLDETLTVREREAIVLRCFEKMPIDLITSVLRVEGASGARGLLQTARRKLRAALERDADGDGMRTEGDRT